MIKKLFKLKLIKSPVIVLLLIILLSIILKWFSISNHHIIFWFDQARDAYISEKIISQKDLKLLGPSASGTNDTVYHGVLYYYFIAPFYYLSKGDPILPVIALSILGSLSIIPFFYFTKRLFYSERTAWIAVVGFAFSTELAQLTHWLSNPSLAVLPLVVFFWSVWEVGYKNKKSFIIPLSLALGLSLQSALWFAYLFGVLLVAALYNMHHFSKKSVLRDKKVVFYFFVILFLITSSILLGQLMLWHNGIFSLRSLSNGDSIINSNDILNLLRVYFTKLIQSASPGLPIASLFLVILAFTRLVNLKKDQKIFFLSWFTAPFWLFMLEPRGSIHILMSVEIALILLLSYEIYLLWKTNKKVLRFVAITLSLAYLIGNLRMLKIYRDLSVSIFSPQQGTNLADQLELIDYTYQASDFNDFSFSVFSNPNGYYITWAYLYNWYGKNKYGYLPTYIGPSQTGLFGSNLLPQSSSAIDVRHHFTIVEPNLDIVPLVIKDKFKDTQKTIGVVKDREIFGSTLVENRITQ